MKSIKLDIDQKKRIYKCVSCEFISLEHLSEARLRVKAAIKEANIKSYNRYIKKGIAYLKNNDSKNLFITALYKHGTKNVITNSHEVLDIITELFCSLSYAMTDETQKIKIMVFHKLQLIKDQLIT